MKLYLEDDRGMKHEIERAVGVQSGDIILFMNVAYRQEAIEEFESVLSKKLNRKVVILDGKFRDIAVVPPVFDSPDGSSQTDRPD